MKQFRPVLVGLLIAVAISGCGKNRSSDVSADGRIASATIPLGSRLIGMLGRLEGPYTFDKALTPSIVQLKPPSGEPVRVTLLGLRDARYPQPQDPNDKRTPEQRREDLKQFYKFKMDELASLAGSRPLYAIRMGPGDAKTPAPAYLFMTDSPVGNMAAPTGSGELVNALALRRGIANMDLDGPDHPMHALMLECQAAAIVEARRAKARGGEAASVWGRFGVQLPAAHQPQVDSMEKKL